jgi:hypothetical protein
MTNPLQKTKILFTTTLIAAALFAGCGDSESFVFTNTNAVPVQPIAQPPIALADNFQALGDATLNQAAAGVLANDTVNGATITAFDAIGSQGGAINLNADGSFTYTPVVGFVGAETFTYTLSNLDGDSTATVTLTSTGFGRFVDNSGANGTGTQASPFNNLADALTAAQSGDTIYVGRGDGNNTGVPGGFTLPAGVKLVGEGTGLILGQTIEPAGTAPLINGPITCGGDNLIQGFTIDGSTTDCIIINSVGNVTVSDNTIGNPTDSHIECDDAAGTITFDSNILRDPPDTDVSYLCLQNLDTNATFSITNNTFENASNNDVFECAFVLAEGTSALNLNFSDNQAIGTVADQFETGLTFDNGGSGSCTVSADRNTLTNFESDAIQVLSTDGPISGTISGNMITNTGVDGIYASAGFGSTLTISDNVITNINDGMCLFFDTNGGTLIVNNNNVSNASNHGIDVGELDFDANGRIAIRNNMLTDSGSDSVHVEMDDNGSICCDITGNTVNDNMRFDNDGGGAIDVERRTGPDGGPLEAVNTFTAGAPIYENGTINSRAAGFCAIP